MKKSLLKKIGIVLSILLGFCILNYFMLIPLNLRYTGIFVIFIVFLLILFFLFNTNWFEKKYITIGKEVIETKLPNKNISYILVSAMFLVILHSLSSTPLLFSKQYQNLIGKVEEKDFVKDFEIIENDKLPIVDLKYAEKLGDKKLGSDRGLGSEYHVGEFSDVVVNGKMMMVAPLEYNGFFKWLNNKSTPGYVTVDKITGEVELVTEINGKQLELKYLESAYFNNNLKRHVYYNNNMDNALIKTTFELDDEGNPYFIINKTHKTIGINGGDDIKSVIVVNAQTGKVKEYKPSEAPEWVDTVYPKELVLKQLDDWGLYVNGFWNTLFSEKNIVKVTEGSRRVYNNNNLYHYTGMTSSGADESTVGFAFIDTKTKQTIFYKMTGATEGAAMKSAEGKVENYGYTSSFPIPINIADEPTFFVTLKDATGLIKQFAFINIEDYSIVGNGDTILNALDSYIKILNKEYIPDNDDVKEITGIISRFGMDITNGSTNYYLMIEDNNDLFYASSTISKELNVTKIGDKVKLKINKGRIISFENITIGG